MSNPNIMLSKLRLTIQNYFSDEEVKSLCFDIEIPYDDLPAQGKGSKVRELIAYATRYNKLDLLIQQVKQMRPDIFLDNIPQTIRVPFVIAAMTHDEAKNLAKDLKNTDAKDFAKYNELEISLQNEGFDFLTNHYGSRREDWKPYNGINSTIEQIIQHLCAKFNDEQDLRNDNTLIKESFFSADFFSKDTDINLSAWEQLKESSCIIIVDPMSLYHPRIKRLLRDSSLLGNDNVAIYVLSPINHRELAVNTDKVPPNVKTKYGAKLSSFFLH